jgi:hypothetical protein
MKWWSILLAKYIGQGGCWKERRRIALALNEGMMREAGVYQNELKAAVTLEYSGELRSRSSVLRKRSRLLKTACRKVYEGRTGESKRKQEVRERKRKRNEGRGSKRSLKREKERTN